MELKYNDFNFIELVNSVSKWSWQELVFGVDNKFITDSEIIEYAKFILTEDIVGFDFVLELSIAEGDEDIQGFLRELVSLESIQNEQSIKEKWLYAILLHLYNNKDKYEDALDMVEEIYADFDYPEEMAGFVKYMPAENSAYGFESYPCENLYKLWQRYLKSKEGIFK